MTLQEFVEKTVSENKDYVEEVRKLSEILESLGENQQRPRIYAISVTSNT
jgi:hypothetical protein